MIRVHVICEGQTEEMFVNEVLSRLLEVGIGAIRRECPLFNGWVKRLEALTPS